MVNMTLCFIGYSPCYAGDCIKRASNQIGSRYRRSRTAAARNIAATASPTHRPGVLKNCSGVSAEIISIMFPLRAVVLEGAGPAKRYCNTSRKYEVLNTIFSTPQITNGGKNAHIKGARGAQAETSSNQPYRGAYHRP